MGKNIEVSLEVFGNKKLTAVLTPEEIRGKNVGEIINYFLTKEWQGEDKQTKTIISREVGSSGKYVPSVGVESRDMPVKFQPVKLGEQIDKYVNDVGLPEDQIRISITGDHIVGYRI